MNRFATKSLLVPLLTLAWVDAHAYIDPGTGSTIISAIVGLFVALGVAVKTYWYKIKGWFKPKPEPVENQGEQGQP